MAECPSCGRPVAVAAARCLYCAAPLTAPLPPAPAAPAPSRLLLILDLAGADAPTLARALRLGAFEAGLLARRGGLHLHRLAAPEAASEEARRLAEEGLATLLVPEGEARTPPLRATAGEWTPAGLLLRTETGPLVLAPGTLQLVLTGEIVREYQPRYDRRRQEPTRVGQRWLAHLHRRGETAALEIDPATLGIGGSLTGSARLEVEAWIEALAEGVARDDGFRRLPPALAPAQPDLAASAVAAVDALAHGRRAPRRAEPRLLLDNLEQFRFYSGWRGAVERRRPR